jgi:hypothetical protein
MFCDLVDGQARVVASRADEYRRRAQRCLEMADAFSDEVSRAALSHMAEPCLRLAKRNDFIAPVTTGGAQPIIQQQQQIQPKQGQRGPAGLANMNSQCPHTNSKLVRP